MNGEQYRETITALGLNIGTAALFMQIDKRTSRRYANNEIPVPRPIARFLGFVSDACERCPELHELIEQHIRDERS